MYVHTSTSSSQAVNVRSPGLGPAARVRWYFASDSRRTFQTVLGLLWLLDAGLQFQSYMYSRQFPDSLADLASGQPAWLGDSITWGAHLAGSHLVVFNSLFALTQAALGLGLLWRRTVKPAILGTVAWSLVVWWFGEGLGQLLTGTANMLTGAPGAVILYAVVALAVWPSKRPGGLLGVAGTRLAWAVVWLLGAALWLLGANRAADATHETIMMTPAGMTAPAPMHWLSRLEGSASMAAAGHGLLIAVVLAALSVLIAVPVALNRRPEPFVVLGILLSLAYWVIGQSFGGIVFTPSATDPNSGPLLVLLGLVVYALAPAPARAGQAAANHAVSRPSGRPRGSPESRGRRSSPARRLRPGELLAAVGTVSAVALLVAALLDGPTAPAPQPEAAVTPFEGQTLNPPTVPPPVALHDDRGRPVSLSQYTAQGKAVLLTFLTTRCAPGCALVAHLRRTLAAMPAGERARLVLVAISTDPRADTPAHVAAFLRRQHMAGRLQFLLGSAAQLEPVWTEWDLPDAQGGIIALYGISASGEVLTTYSALFSAGELVHDVKRLEAY